jgi:predicted RecB family nuclease
MEAGAKITAAVLAAYLKCRTKAYLTAHREESTDSVFADLRKRVSAAYKAAAGQRAYPRLTAAVDFSRLADGIMDGASTMFVDCETAWYNTERPARAWAEQAKITDSSHSHGLYVPILYSAWEKSDQSDHLLICFGALGIAQSTGTKIPQKGKVVYGERHCTKAVKITNHIQKTCQVIEEIGSTCFSNEPPPLILNDHCSTCEFQSRCRALAVEQENLSLLRAMTAKERIKCQEKGISTLTQLSYGYRPRRRKRKKTTSAKDNRPSKNDNKLKALAIKKAQIHIVGSPSLSIDGTPVFMDVEGMPDRNFYYLVGLHYEVQGEQVEQSFWASRSEDEQNMWHRCLRAIKQIANPQIIHYGAYELRFLKRMMERYQLGLEDAELVERLVSTSVNLLATIYGQIYFPTYSNGLKDVARMLGFEWTWREGSGSAALLLRRCWELTSDNDLRRTLTTYNVEDCRATGMITKALSHICSNGGTAELKNLESVHVGSLEVGFSRTFGSFVAPCPDSRRSTQLRTGTIRDRKSLSVQIKHSDELSENTSLA